MSDNKSVQVQEGPSPQTANAPPVRYQAEQSS